MNDAPRPIWVTVPELNAVPGLIHGFTERGGGVSPIPELALNFGRSVGDSPENISENLRRLGEAAGFDPACLAFLKQVHGNHVVTRVNKGDLSRVNADAQITDQPGIVLAVLIADCLPILVVDRRRRAVAAVHAGWRGTRGRILARAIESMRAEFRSTPGDLRVALGPGIRVDAYEVGEDVAATFRQEFGVGSGVVRETPGNRPHLDLFRANWMIAVESGVPEAQVFDLGLCTATHVARFFSHRAENGRTGRAMAFVGFA